jgi:hypothetical protein
LAQTDKTAAYLGLCRKAGKLTLGVNAVQTLRGGVHLLIADEKVAQNSRREIEKLQKKFGCPLIFISDLGEKTGAPMRMLAAVREEHLARAIMSACKE